MPTVFEIIFRGILKILLKVPKTSEIVLCLFFFLSGNHGDHEKPLWVSGYRGQGWEKEFRPSALKSIPKPKLSQACPRPAEDQGQVQFWNTRRKQAPRLWNSLEHHHCGSYAGRRLDLAVVPLSHLYLWQICRLPPCFLSQASLQHAWSCLWVCVLHSIQANSKIMSMGIDQISLCFRSQTCRRLMQTAGAKRVSIENAVQTSSPN